MKIKTSKLTGTALDWAVAKALWGDVTVSTFGPLFGKGYAAPCFEGRAVRFKPSTDWAQGGPLIEREKISVIETGDAAKWEGRIWDESTLNFRGWYGPTPLIAAMMAYVASKLGDEVEVPDGLW